MRSSVRACVLALALVACFAAGVDARRPHQSSYNVHAPSGAQPALQAQPNDPRPIIGIFSLANSDDPKETGSMIPASYVKWLEQAGARVAVVPFNAPHDVLDQLFDGINGLLFTGGGLSLDADTLFFQNALYLFNKAMAANDAGEVFPIWGSCQGFQMLHLLAAQPANHQDILKCNIYDTSNIGMPLVFTAVAPNSHMFGPAMGIPAVWDGENSRPSIYEALATTNITINLHNCGVNPSDFERNPILPRFYKLLSKNVAPNGIPFVSSIEGVKYPFGATQWHAERPQYEWNPTEDLSHSAPSMVVHSYMAQRFMFNARLSTHKFPTVADELKSIIQNYPLTFTQYRQAYEFKFDFNSVAQE